MPLRRQGSFTHAPAGDDVFCRSEAEVPLACSDGVGGITAGAGRVTAGIVLPGMTAPRPAQVSSPLGKAPPPNRYANAALVAPGDRDWSEALDAEPLRLAFAAVKAGHRPGGSPHIFTFSIALVDPMCYYCTVGAIFLGKNIMNAIDGLVRLERPARRVAAKVSILIAVGAALLAPPALPQGLTAPGVAPTAPQPRVAAGAKDNAALWAASASLSGVVATLTDPSGGRTRRAISNREGVLSLGVLSEGSYDIAIELAPARAGTSQPERQQVLVGMLVPATQTLVGTTAWIRTVTGKVRVVIGPKGEPRAVTAIDGVTHEDTWDVTRFGAAGGRDVKLVFLLPSSPRP